MAVDVTGGREDGNCYINGHHSEGNHVLRELRTDYQSVAPASQIPVRPLETPIFRSAVVKDLATHPDFGAISPVQRRKTGVLAAACERSEIKIETVPPLP